MSAAAMRWVEASSALFLALLMIASFAHGDEATTSPSDQPPPLKLTAEQDHQQMMDQLHITTIRRGADGTNRNSPFYANYDETKANPYPNLPDALMLKNGQKVTSAEMWWNQRRPQIVEDFDREIYGRVPKETPKVTWEILSSIREKNGNVPVITKKLVGHVDNSSYPQIKVNIQLTLSTPAGATGPVPVMMEFGFTFPPAGFRPGGIATTRPGGARPPGAFGGGGPTWQSQVLAKGWGYATISPNTI
jgi:hypothetical protein